MLLLLLTLSLVFVGGVVVDVVAGVCGVVVVDVVAVCVLFEWCGCCRRVCC